MYPQQKHLQSRDQQLCKPKPGSVHWDWMWLAKETWINRAREDTTGRFAPAQAPLPWAVTSTCQRHSTSTTRVERDFQLLAWHLERLQHPKVFTAKAKQPPNVPLQCIFSSSELTELMDLFIYVYMRIKRQKLVSLHAGFLPIGKTLVMRSRV